MKDNTSLSFNFIIASSIHDMKNSLGMLLQSLEEIHQEANELELPITDRMATLQYEATRVNNDLVQLLGLYKLNEKQLRVNIDEHFLTEFLEEQIARYAPLFQARHIHYEMDCDPDLTGYFDSDLISGVINNVLANAIRYSQQHIRIRASEHDNGLKIIIEDDGPGFPEVMIKQPSHHSSRIDFESGSTNLGLYFAQQIANLHTQGDRRGKIDLSNNDKTGGGCFCLWLP